MDTPNQILSLARAKAYFPTITSERLPDIIFQELLDDIMADVNERLGVDLSGGDGNEITQVFRWQTVPNKQLRLSIPADLDEVITLYEDSPARLVPPENYVMYNNQLHRNPNNVGYFRFDRVNYVGNPFQPPVSITYTPRSSAIRVVRQTMLNMLLIRLRHFNADGEGEEAFGQLKHVKDQEQEYDIDTTSNGMSDTEAYQAELNNLSNLFKGPRIG